MAKKEPGRECNPALCHRTLSVGVCEETAADGRIRPDYKSLDTVVKMPCRLLPTAVKPAIAATAIRAAIKPYSIAVAPFSSRSRLTKNADNISSLLGLN